MAPIAPYTMTTMKICLCLQRRFAYIGHALAERIHTQHSDISFCAYVYTRQSADFLRRQTLVPYTELLLDEDVHEAYKREPLDMDYLRSLERDYGIPNLWPYIELDRIVRHNQLVREYPHNTPRYTHEEMLRILQVKAKRVIEFLDKERPDVIFFSAIGAISLLLLYHIAKKRGIRTICLTLNFLPGKIALSDHYAYFNPPPAPIPREALHEARRLISSFRERPTKYSDIHDPAKQRVTRREQFSFLRPRNMLRSATWFFHLLGEHYRRRDRYDYSYIHPWWYAADRLRRKIRNLERVGYDRFDPDAPYAFFPLQLEPEISLLLLAPFHTDQLHVIRQTAAALPVGYVLYVKEHPHMVPYRQRAFYREIQKIPNVKLLNPSVNSFDIVRSARLITTITGTVGWEATLLKKPVITFGDIFYNPLPNVRRCRAYEDLPQIVLEQLNRPAVDDDELTRFVAGALVSSAPVDLLYLWEKETDESKKRERLAPLSDALVHMIRPA